jgi:tripartite-type tricarboxylate transporter receptor subunit TctC
MEISMRFVSKLFAGLLTALPLPALAQDSVRDFYQGRQMRFVIRSEPGSGYDLFSRLVGEHIVRHIPGNPLMIPQNMPGGGGLRAANFVGELAPKDGSVLTMVSQALPMDQSLGFTPGLKADLRTFGWIGNLGDSNLLTYVWHTVPVKTMADAMKRETTIGASGAGSVTSWLPEVYNQLFGAKFKIINGYKSANDIRLAMERGEVDGYAANPYSALIAASPEVIAKGQINILVQVGTRKEKALPDVPLLPDLARNAADREILDFICKSFSVGRPISTTPGVPAERLAALRKAFDATMVDPVFLAAAEKLGTEIAPINGKDLQALIDELMNAPENLKARVRAVLPPRS